MYVPPLDCFVSVQTLREAREGRSWRLTALRLGHRGCLVDRVFRAGCRDCGHVEGRFVDGVRGVDG